MKLCVYGAGAIGGYLGVELQRAGHEVSLIARGPHLEAIRKNGLTLLIEGERRVARVLASDDPAQAGPQDAVFLTLKAHSVPAVVDRIAPLLRADTSVVTAQNGIPWWYFFKLPGPWENRRVESVDPGGRIWETLGPERAIGSVVYPSCEIVEPGVVRHIDGRRIMLGEPDGSRSERIASLSKALTAAGFKAPVRDRIRDDIWLKLWGNVSFNPVSVLTGATLEQMAGDAPVRKVIRDMMAEAQAVAEKLGVRFSVDVDTRIGWAEDVGAHKTSMLQDLELGRPMEIDALVGSVSELGRLVGLETPTIDVVLAAVRLRARLARPTG
jgi:2-dehydropantoate 2-reductase